MRISRIKYGMQANCKYEKLHRHANPEEIQIEIKIRLKKHFENCY